MAATVEWLVWLEDSVHLKDGDDRAGYHYSQAAVHSIWSGSRLTTTMATILQTLLVSLLMELVIIISSQLYSTVRQ